MNIEHLLRPVEILLVDDNPGDVRLMMEALREAKAGNGARLAEDREPSPAGRQPDESRLSSPPSELILRDLNLPKNDGREVLTEIESDPNLRRIPVVIVTSAGARKAENRHSRASCYLTEPLDLGQFISTINTVENFWYTVVHLPAEEAADGQ